MVSVRLARSEDVAAVFEMVQGLAWHHGDVPSVTMESLRRDLFGPVTWMHALVADQVGELVGYATLLPLARLHLGQRGMDLHHLYVAQSARGRGIGQALFESARQHAIGLGCTYFTVGTSAANHAAHRFYLNAGFADKPLEGRRFAMDL